MWKAKVPAKEELLADKISGVWLLSGSLVWDICLHELEKNKIQKNDC